MNASRVLLFWLLLLIGNMTHAEGNCPPGYYPIGAPQGQAGPQSCAPIPGYGNGQQQQRSQQWPPPRWVSRWGAIATDSVKGILGAVTDLPSKSRAQQAAITDCQTKGGSPCKLEVAYDNECAAMAVGSNGYDVVADTTLNRAIQGSMKMCVDDKSEGCHVYYSACSLPVQIQ